MLDPNLERNVLSGATREASKFGCHACSSFAGRFANSQLVSERWLMEQKRLDLLGVEIFSE